MADVTYALGDIHGRKDLLDRAENILYLVSKKIPSNNPCVRLIGDYVDIGPDSKKVMDTIISSSLADMPMFSMLGNHELWLSRVVSMALMNNPDCCSWLNNDTLKTIQSYGIDINQIPNDRNEQMKILTKFARAVPESHIEYIKKHMSSLSIDDNIIYAHAGIDKNKDINNQHIDVLTSGIDQKGGFPDCGYNGDMPVVMGHLVKKTPFISRNGKIIDLDTNAVGTGILTCGIFTDGTLGGLLAITPKDGIDFVPVIVDDETIPLNFIRVVINWWKDVLLSCKEPPILIFNNEKREDLFRNLIGLNKYKRGKNPSIYKKSGYEIMPIMSISKK